MHFHNEGHRIIAGAGFLLLLASVFSIYTASAWLSISALLLLLLFIFILQFFRNPDRPIPEEGDQLVYAPADGKVVAIEEVQEEEYFQAPRIQISIFMSPLNVHVNRNPIGGEVKYHQYHPGKYLVAWHPKSSTENEHTTVVIEGLRGPVLVRQIAGAVARRISNYLQVGQRVEQGSEMGFIKFGSRVDVLLPPEAELRVRIGDAARGNRTVLAELK